MRMRFRWSLAAALTVALILLTPLTAFAITWHSRAPLPSARAGLAIAVVGNNIYALGGFKVKELKTAAVYDTILNSWTSVPAMHTARGGLAAASAGSKVYAIGGCKGGASDPVNCDFGGTSLRAVDALDTTTNTWTVMAAMPTARADLAAVTGADGKIYAIGGWNVRNSFNDPVALDTVEAYDPVANTWTARAPMPTARYWLSAALGSDGKIYAYGGVDTTTNTPQVFEAYDPNTNTWTQLAGFVLSAAGQVGAGAAFLGSRVYVIGGSDIDYVPHNQVEAYNIATSKWSIQVPMSTARGYLAAATVGTHVYAIGGYNNQSPFTGPLRQVERF